MLSSFSPSSLGDTAMICRWDISLSMDFLTYCNIIGLKSNSINIIRNIKRKFKLIWHAIYIWCGKNIQIDRYFFYLIL